MIATAAVERPPPPLELEFVAVGDTKELVLVVEVIVVVVVVTVPFGAGTIVIVPHRTGPHGILTMPKNPLASPEYSIWNAFCAQIPTVPPAVVALPTLGTVQLKGPVTFGIATSATLTLFVLQYSVPLIDVISVTTGDVPSDPQSRIILSPALYEPPAGSAQVMLAETCETRVATMTTTAASRENE